MCNAYVWGVYGCLWLCNDHTKICISFGIGCIGIQGTCPLSDKGVWVGVVPKLIERFVTKPALDGVVQDGVDAADPLSGSWPGCE